MLYRFYRAVACVSMWLGYAYPCALCLVPIPVHVYWSQGVRFRVGWQVLGDLRAEKMKVLLNIAVRQCNTHEAVCC
jgi:hypothetical protein